MNRATWLDLHGPQDDGDPLHAAELATARAIARGDVCPECGSSLEVVSTRYGWQVVCQYDGEIIEEVEL